MTNHAVHLTLRERAGYPMLSGRFDAPPDAGTTELAHAVELLTQLLHLRGWRQHDQEILIGLAANWHDQWWDDTAPEGSIAVESPLGPDAGANIEDLKAIIRAVKTAWPITHDTVCLPSGIILASADPDALGVAMQDAHEAIQQKLATLPEGVRCRTFAHVLVHLEGTPIEGWSLPGRTCAWQSKATDARGKARTFIALRDTSPRPNPVAARDILRRMLARDCEPPNRPDARLHREPRNAARSRLDRAPPVQSTPDPDSR